MRSFPIFISFEGKPPLVVGGGARAALQTGFLLKTAAVVDLAAMKLVPELSDLVRLGQVVRLALQPGIDQIRGRPLVIAASDDGEEDARVSAIARALGVPVNVPARDDLSTCALPAFEPGTAAAEGPHESDELEATPKEASQAKAKPARVLLVGAGPGDPELLTLKAVKALKSADVIFYDRLVGDGVLGHAPREAELIPVGKAKGAHSVPQSEINALLIARVKAGQTVVRLKGGDPFIFGRGGEELDALRAEGIAIEVVPGITASTAAAASLQIPLTHRDMSHTVTFISGHEAGGTSPSFEHLNLKALSGGKNTLVVYMGVTTAATVAAKLLEAGFSPALPVIAVENASRHDERRVAMTIAALAADPERLGLKSPAILIFGEVARLPASGVVEEILASDAVKRVSA